VKVIANEERPTAPNRLGRNKLKYIHRSWFRKRYRLYTHNSPSWITL